MSSGLCWVDDPAKVSGRTLPLSQLVQQTSHLTLFLTDALIAGLAPDRGLYVPERILQLRLPTKPPVTLADTAAWVLAPYFGGSVLRNALPALCARAYDFDAPLVPLVRSTAATTTYWSCSTARPTPTRWTTT